VEEEEEVERVQQLVEEGVEGEEEKVGEQLPAPQQREPLGSHQLFHLPRTNTTVYRIE
jgi:hypothetical protein